MAFDMPEPCTLPSLDSCQKRFLWIHKGVGFKQVQEQQQQYLLVFDGSDLSFPTPNKMDITGTVLPARHYLLRMLRGKAGDNL